MPLERIRQWRNFEVVPYVELEDVFVNKAVRSLQMKLRECLVIPPTERPTQRFSVIFPTQVCNRESLLHDPAAADPPAPAAAVDDAPVAAAADPPAPAAEEEPPAAAPARPADDAAAAPAPAAGDEPPRKKKAKTAPAADADKP